MLMGGGQQSIRIRMSWRRHGMHKAFLFGRDKIKEQTIVQKEA